MVKKILCFALCFALMTMFIFSEIMATFPDLGKPYRIMVNENKLYILEDQKVYIYSIDDYKLLNKFGKTGEGPREFMRRLNITAYKDYLVINSQGKISYWTKMGKFIREVKSPFAGGVELLGKDMYVGNGFRRRTPKDPVNYNTIVLYDSKFKKIREIDKKQANFQRKYIKFFGQAYYFINSRTKKWIYVIGHDGMKINVFNEKGDKLFVIEEPYQKIKVTETDIKAVEDSFNDTRARHFFEENRNRFRYETYKPAIKNFLEYDNLIYVETWKRKDNKTEFYVFGQDGKLKSRMFLPLVMIDFRRSYPYFIDKGKFYQLVENEDEEIWELHVTDLNI